MSKSDIWMPLHIGDYLSDTMRLTTVQHGAYMLLLMQYWKSGPLPDDEDELAGIVKMEPKAWAKIAPTIRRFFTVEDDGLLHQKRADAERAKSAAISQKRRDAVAQRPDRKTTDKKQTDGDGGSNDGSPGPQTDDKEPTNVEQLNVQKNHQLNTHTRGLPQPPSKNSEANASDAEAASKSPSARDRIWSEGLPALAHITGKSPNQCRSLLGKLLRDVRDDCPKLLLILQQACEADLADPVAWLHKAVAPSAETPAERKIREDDEAILRMVGRRPEPVIDHEPELFEPRRLHS